MVSFSVLYAIPLTEIRLKTTFEATKPNICLSDLIEMPQITPRAAEKFRQYCRIEFKGARMTLSAKDIELHSWAAGVIPDKISGGPVVISKATSLQLPKAESAAPQRRVRRGTAVQLVIRSEHMQIAREAAILADAFPGETVDVRPHGTRKTLKAKLLTQSTAELMP